MFAGAIATVQVDTGDFVLCYKFLLGIGWDDFEATVSVSVPNKARSDP